MVHCSKRSTDNKNSEANARDDSGKATDDETDYIQTKYGKFTIKVTDSQPGTRKNSLV